MSDRVERSCPRVASRGPMSRRASNAGTLKRLRFGVPTCRPAAGPRPPHRGPVLAADRPAALQLRLSWRIGSAVLPLNLLDGILDAQLGDARDGEPGVPIGRVLHPLDEVVSQVDGELFLLVALDRL